MIRVLLLLLSIIILSAALTFSWLQPNKVEQLSPQQTTTVRIINRLVSPYGIKVLNLDSENISLKQLQIPRLVLQVDDSHIAVQNLSVSLKNSVEMLLSQSMGPDNITSISADHIYIDLGVQWLNAPDSSSSGDKASLLNQLDAIPQINIGELLINLPQFSGPQQQSNNQKPNLVATVNSVSFKPLVFVPQQSFDTQLFFDHQPYTTITGKIAKGTITLSSQIDLQSTQRRLVSFTALWQRAVNDLGGNAVHSPLFQLTQATEVSKLLEQHDIAFTGKVDAQVHYPLLSRHKKDSYNNESKAANTQGNQPSGESESVRIDVSFSDLMLAKHNVASINFSFPFDISVNIKQLNNVDRQSVNLISSPFSARISKNQRDKAFQADEDIKNKLTEFDTITLSVESLLQADWQFSSKNNQLPFLAALDISPFNGLVSIDSNTISSQLILQELQLSNSLVEANFELTANAKPALSEIAVELFNIQSFDFKQLNLSLTGNLGLSLTQSMTKDTWLDSYKVNLDKFMIDADELFVADKTTQTKAKHLQLNSHNVLSIDSSAIASTPAVTIPSMSLHAEHLSTNRSTSLGEVTEYKTNAASIALAETSSLSLKPLSLSNSLLNWHFSPFVITRIDSKRRRSLLLKIDNMDVKQQLSFDKHLVTTHENWFIDDINLQSSHWLSLIGNNPTFAGSWQFNESISQLYQFAKTSVQASELDSQLGGIYKFKADFALNQYNQDKFFQIKIDQQASNFSGSYYGYHVEDASLTALCQFDWQSTNQAKRMHTQSQLSCPQMQLAVPNAYLGIDLQNLNLDTDIQLTRNSQKPSANWLQKVTGLSETDINISAKASLLNGFVAIPKMNLKLHDISQGYVLLQGLQLEQLLDQQPISGINATGIFDGVFPAKLENGLLTIAGGKIAARKPGGLIQVQTNQAMDEMTKSQPQLETVFTTLSNLHYQQLSGNFELTPQGLADFYIQVKGKHPEFTRPIHFNYSQQQYLMPLYQSLIIPDNIEQGIEQRLTK
ncbi:YdbH domain-containing protein [Shewanella maritima]|uniref:intermembrane phospholipid transport protein YdbH family protein n=1 Tax=Shewanella maritima TaxID=2520507 RepID=UPI0037359CF2